MKIEALQQQWKDDLKRQPAALTAVCLCGLKPAPKSNISGIERPRCQACFCSEYQMQTDFGMS